MPAIRPMIIADGMVTESAPAVIPTKPARTPLSAIDKSGFLRNNADITIEPSAPAAAASAVVTQT